MDYYEKKSKKAVQEKYDTLTEQEKQTYLMKSKKRLKKIFLTFLIIGVCLSIIVSGIMAVILYFGNDEYVIPKIAVVFIVFGAVFLIVGLGSLISFIYIYYFKLRSQEDKIKNFLSVELREDVKKQIEYEDSHKEETVKKKFGDNFSLTRELILCDGKIMLIDDVNKQFILQVNHNFTRIYRYDEIINYEVYENGASVVKGTVGEVLIGGIFFGLAGMIAGSSSDRKISETCSSLQLAIRLNNLEKPQILIEFMSNVPLDKNSSQYIQLKNNLKEACAILEYFINNTTPQVGQSEISKMEQLQEYKNMLDNKLLTEEEFDKLKKKLLDL